ncbi:putative ATPase, partial [Lacticaseibacillus paracasei subsp. paracasei Lpp70]
MRQQLSMFQNQASFDYLFGASHSQRNFARDLSNRESNVILLDEFDKVNPALYSAFYQLFDEGIFEDKNYQIRTNNLIIICTSNFADVTQIRETLGDAMYYRFSALGS